MLFNSKFEKEKAIKSAEKYASSFECKVTEIALHLRVVIMQLRRTCGELPSPLTVEAFAKGQACPPDVVIQFFRVLYSGSEKVSTRRVEQFVQSSAQDAVSATTRGNVKPAKHLCLGL